MANLIRAFRICRTMCKESHLARNEAWSEAVQAARDLCQEAFSCREEAQKSRIEDLFSIVETGKNFRALPRDILRRCVDEVHGVPCKQALHTSAAVRVFYETETVWTKMETSSPNIMHYPEPTSICLTSIGRCWDIYARFCVLVE